MLGMWSASRASMLGLQAVAASSVAGLCLSFNCPLSSTSSARRALPAVDSLARVHFTGSKGFQFRVPGPSKSISSSSGPSSILHTMSAEEGEEIVLLPAVDDDHGGVIIEIKEPMEPQNFISSLRLSMINWRHSGKKGVWMKLPIEFSNLVHPAVKEGFWYHHAEPSYLMLVYWIPATKHTLPVNATHRVGVGAFVLNDKREVLAVQEKSGKFRGTGIWKFPTGVVDPGEDIHAAVVREVKEETGIDAEFVEVLGFRQSHRSFFEKSDLFFVCFLRPLSFDIRKQESEIEAAQWIPIEEFEAQPFVRKHELVQYIIGIGLAKAGESYSGFSSVPISSAFSEQISHFFLNSCDMNNV